jgi:tetratricopeptide (TPR) repeat protein
MNSRKPTAAAERRPVLDLFEKAMRALSKHDHDKAAEQFEALIRNHPEERDVAERARLYLGLCERPTARRPAPKPKSFEDLLVHGVYLHNRGEYAEALKTFAQAAEMHPKNEHVLYCTAAAAARAGDAETALKALKGAIQASPANRAQARLDEDFAGLGDHPGFAELLEPADE